MNSFPYIIHSHRFTMCFHHNLYTLVAIISTICLSSVAFKYENCPGPISVDTTADSDTVAVTWERPYTIEVGHTGSISQTVSHNQGEEFPIGLTRVNYLAINSTDYRDLQVCTFVITVHDHIPPVFNTCPINVTSRLGPDQTGIAVTWDIPQAVDNSKYVQLLSTSEPGDNFTAGAATVSYTARDMTGNEVHCDFPVIVIPFITPTTTVTAAETTTTAPLTEVTIQQSDKTASSGQGVLLTAKPIDWKLWTSRGLISVSVLCLLCFTIIALFMFRKYHTVRRLKKERGNETEMYPSSAGEEYDMWEDPPGSPAFQVNPGMGGNGEVRRLNKYEERPLLVVGGGH